MNNLSKIWHVFVVALFLIFASYDCVAQDVFKSDIPKTGAKFADWVQKQYENFQSTMEQISQSQFATTIGDGIKAAKEGIAWAKDKYQSAIKLYNDTKDAIVNSTEYKAALISKQIAEETMVLERMQEENAKQLTALKEDYELQKDTLNNKLKQAQENLLNGASILQDQLNTTKDEEEKKSIQNEIEAFKLSIEEEENKINEEITTIDVQLAAEIASLTKELGEQTYLQGEKIAELTRQLKELLENDKKEKGEGEEDPTKVMEDAKTKFSFKEGVAISLKDKKEKERQKRSSKTTAMLGVMSESATNISSSDNIKEEDEMITGTSSTQAGKSDSVHNGAHKATLSQIDSLYKYLKLELKYLEYETLKRIASDNTQVRAVEDATTTIDICNYDEDTISNSNAFGMLIESKIKTPTLPAVKVELPKAKNIGDFKDPIAQKLKDNISTKGIN